LDVGCRRQAGSAEVFALRQSAVLSTRRLRRLFRRADLDRSQRYGNYSQLHSGARPAKSAFKDETPIYYINVILDEGVIVESKLVGEEKEKVKLGDKVKVVFQETHNPEIKLPCFKLAG
jgi:hypothetical protein